MSNSSEVKETHDGENEDLEKKAANEKVSDENSEEKIYSKGEMDKLLKEKDEEITSLKDKLLRSHADFDNYKKRNIKQQEQNKKMVVRNMAVDMIDINDNLLRASEAARQIQKDESLEDAHKNYVDGVLMLSKSIEAALEKHGIDEIVSINEPFDPNKHEAVEINMSSEVDSDTVTKVHQKGFQLDDFVIRSAKVCVTKPAPVAAEEKSSDEAGAEQSGENA